MCVCVCVKERDQTESTFIDKRNTFFLLFLRRSDFIFNFLQVTKYSYNLYKEILEKLSYNHLKKNSKLDKKIKLSSLISIKHFSMLTKLQKQILPSQQTYLFHIILRTLLMDGINDLLMNFSFFLHHINPLTRRTLKKAISSN